MPGLSSYVIIAVLVLVTALPFIKGRIRPHFETLLLIVCTVSTFIFFGQMMHGDARPAKVQSQISEERAESALRLMSTINIGVAKAYRVFGSLHDEKGNEHRALDVSNTGLSSYFKTAETSLKDAIQRSPDNPVLKAKLVVLLSVWGKHQDLVKSTCNLLKEARVEADRQLGEVLWRVFVQHYTSSKGSDAGKRLKIIESGISRGWYQYNAILALYKSSNESTEYDSFAKQLEDRYYRTFCLAVAAVLFGSLCAFAGIVVIVMQLGSLLHDDSPKKLEIENSGLDLSIRTVYSVFVGWITSQLAIGECLKFFPKGLLSLGGSPLGMAVFSLVSYLVTMLPALALIYLIALRPCGLNPARALKLRFRTTTLGPFKLLLAGILSWCAIIPLVLFGSFLASALGSQGSDNPVLLQIASITSSKNVLAIFVLFLTVSCMSPLCEEIIFRGFLYSVLRTRIGIFPAILLSTLIFAGIHFDRGGMLMLCALGPVLAVAFERTRSLLPSVIAHGLWNGGAFAVTLCLYFN